MSLEHWEVFRARDKADKPFVSWYEIVWEFRVSLTGENRGRVGDIQYVTIWRFIGLGVSECWFLGGGILRKHHGVLIYTYTHIYYI